MIAAYPTIDEMAIPIPEEDQGIKKSFGKKFAQKIIDGNLTATRRGYEEVKEG